MAVASQLIKNWATSHCHPGCHHQLPRWLRTTTTLEVGHTERVDTDSPFVPSRDNRHYYA